MIETVILSNLLCNENFLRSTLPYIKEEYFTNASHETIFVMIRDYFDKYNKIPSASAIRVILDDMKLDEDAYNETAKEIGKSYKETPVDEEWLMDQTEKFCQDRAIYNAIRESIKILDDEVKGKTKGDLPFLLQDALAVSFNKRIGHDFFEQAEERFEYYHRDIHRIPFDIEYLNKATRGGFPVKTLNVLMASTGVGKSLTMCHMAANNLMDGKNVLYITLELSEEEVSKRIEANLTKTPINDIEQLPKDSYFKKINRLKDKTNGRLIVQEYPTSGASVIHFRALLNELKQKKNFVPDIIYVDYINICVSARVKLGGTINTYSFVKNIAEELRGLAVEFNVPIVSATQTNRGGFKNSDADLDNTAESWGLPQTVDWMAVLYQDEIMEREGKICLKQLKTRYNDINFYRQFFIGIDKSTMTLYDVDQEGLSRVSVDDDPIMDKGAMADSGGFVFDKDKFEEFK